jgi:hypothetical protein
MSFGTLKIGALITYSPQFWNGHVTTLDLFESIIDH